MKTNWLVCHGAKSHAVRSVHADGLSLVAECGKDFRTYATREEKNGDKRCKICVYRLKVFEAYGILPHEDFAKPRVYPSLSMSHNSAEKS